MNISVVLLFLKKNTIKDVLGKVWYYFSHVPGMFSSPFYFLPIYMAKENSYESFNWLMFLVKKLKEQNFLKYPMHISNSSHWLFRAR